MPRGYSERSTDLGRDVGLSRYGADQGRHSLSRPVFAVRSSAEYRHAFFTPRGQSTHAPRLFLGQSGFDIHCRHNRSPPSREPGKGCSCIVLCQFVYSTYFATNFRTADNGAAHRGAVISLIMTVLIRDRRRLGAPPGPRYAWRRRARRPIAAVALLALGGCVLPPNVPAPKPIAPSHYRGSDKTARANDPSIWPTPAWWRNFDSPELDRLMSQARSANYDIAAAAARVAQADAQIRVSGAPLFPTPGRQGIRDTQLSGRRVAE